MKILVPSLMRPENIERLAMRCPAAPVFLLLNPNDPKLDDYFRIGLPRAWEVHVAREDLIGACALFRYFFQRYPEEDVYGFLGDDAVPPRGFWWEDLARAAGQWGVAWGNDGHHGEDLCTHPFLGGELVRAVGNLAPEGLFHNYWDRYWYEIGRILDLLRYVDSLEFVHLHPAFGTAEPDVVHEIARQAYEEDQAWYIRWRSLRRESDVEEVRRALQNSKSVCGGQAEPLPEGGDVREAV